MKTLLISWLLYIFIFSSSALAQKYIVRDIKSFGAKGNGKTNDQAAFQKAAAYFNHRGGNGKLTISKGIYIIGRQNFTAGKNNKPAYEGENVLHFSKIKNLKITGTPNSVLKFKDSLRFGAFEPATGKPYEHGNNLFINYTYAAFVAQCIYLENCSKVSISGLTMDGNNSGFILGGVWGDVGIQLPHSGIYIQNSNNIIVDKINAHHFGLDGITVENKASPQADSISILNSSFEYNARQGLSWIGGNYLVTNNCKFNNTGKAAFSSAPSAGVDIEAEAKVGPIRNGHFINCEFVNNKGVGLLANNGDNGDCTFTNCTFWGATNWSLWVTKPGFTFNKCNIYGSPVHGYDSPDEKNATKFISCIFEDKSYQGKDPYGNFLLESNNAKRVSFTDCKFIANKKKLFWISVDPKTKPEEKYQFTNCSFIVKNADFPEHSYLAVIRGAVLKNSTFQLEHPNAKRKQYYLEGYTGSNNNNVDLGGNKIIYSGEK
jgi:hypothetical protein